MVGYLWQPWVRSMYLTGYGYPLFLEFWKIAPGPSKIAQTGSGKILWTRSNFYNKLAPDSRDLISRLDIDVSPNPTTATKICMLFPYFHVSRKKVGRDLKHATKIYVSSSIGEIYNLSSESNKNNSTMKAEQKYTCDLRWKLGADRCLQRECTNYKNGLWDVKTQGGFELA